MRKVGIYVMSVILLVALIVGGCAKPSDGEELEPFKVGVSSALTGPAARIAVPLHEGFRCYIENVNDQGGINGRKVELFIEDDRAEPARGSANAKKLCELDCSIIYGAIISALIEPQITECNRYGVPLLGITGDPGIPMAPPTHPLFFTCVSSREGCAVLQARIFKDYMNSIGVEEIKIGLLATNIPGSKLGTVDTARHCRELGMKTVEEFVPMGVTSLSTVADIFNDAGVNCVYYYGPQGLNMLLYREMAKKGWEGINFVCICDSPDVYLPEVKGHGEDWVFPLYAVPMQIPEAQEMLAVLDKYNAAQIEHLNTWGWVGAMIVEGALKQVKSFPPDKEELLNILEHLTVDPRPISGIREYTSDDHCGTWVYVKAYRWSDEEQKVISVTDWYRTDTNGTKVEILGPEL